MNRASGLRVPDYLEHILEAIGQIEKYVDDMSEVDFLNDRKTQDAVLRNFYWLG